MTERKITEEELKTRWRILWETNPDVKKQLKKKLKELQNIGV